MRHGLNNPHKRLARLSLHSAPVDLRVAHHFRLEVRAREPHAPVRELGVLAFMIALQLAALR